MNEYGTECSGIASRMTVNASGSAPMAYQWRKDGADIPEAISAFYTTPPVVLGDNGRAYRCIVANDYGADTSDAAMLTVKAAHRSRL